MSAALPGFVAGFDSASVFVRALGRYLQGKDFPAAGFPRPLKMAAPFGDILPKSARERIYALSGWIETISKRQLDRTDLYRFDSAVAELYPRETYPAAFIGASAGPLIHLAAAMRIPWLPQTFFVPVRQRGIHPDEPAEAAQAAVPMARAVLDNHPHHVLHHMHDANHDRLMIRHLMYFRFKKRTLGPHYERFLKERLRPGGTIIVSECTRKWPTTQMAGRHIFQHGGEGGLRPEEYIRGSERVERFLDAYGSYRCAWPEVVPDGDRPEAEWGFDGAMLDDIGRFAKANGFQLVRLKFDAPQSLSPFTADLYRAWYEERGIHPKRLLGESFLLMDPYWTIRTASVPYWMEFNTGPALEGLRSYIDQSAAFDALRLSLFSNGVESADYEPVSQWEEVLRLSPDGRFIGTRKRAYPRDLASLVRYRDAVKRLRPHVPLPQESMTVEDFLFRLQARESARNEGHELLAA